MKLNESEIHKIRKVFPQYDVSLVDGEIVVTVPEGTTEIIGWSLAGKMGFYEKDGFHKVVLPSSLKKIGAGAFANCHDLREIEIPGGVKVLNDKTFAFCHNLRKVVLNEGLERIGASVFAEDESLNELNIPSTVISLGWLVRDTVYDCEKYVSPFELEYGGRCGIRKEDIVIACPDRFDDDCFRGTRSASDVVKKSKPVSSDKDNGADDFDFDALFRNDDNDDDEEEQTDGSPDSDATPES